MITLDADQIGRVVSGRNRPQRQDLVPRPLPRQVDLDQRHSRLGQIECY